MTESWELRWFAEIGHLGSLLVAGYKDSGLERQFVAMGWRCGKGLSLGLGAEVVLFAGVVWHAGEQHMPHQMPK